MKFGNVPNANNLDLTLPKDHPETEGVFGRYGDTTKRPKIYVGCAKWNRQDLKDFYPRGTKDELAYYSSQFNCIELNATFYRAFAPEQFEKWRDKTPDDFRFFPKLSQEISHYKQLHEVGTSVERYIHSASRLEGKLGTIFLQMHERFGPDRFALLQKFIESWPKEYALAAELRHPDWHNDEKVAKELYELLESNGIANILVDTAGRRDLIHMRMTTPKPFVRYVGANHMSDYRRLDDWVGRIKTWIEQGMTELQFFVHQNIEKESPLLSAYFIEKINSELGSNMRVARPVNGSGPANNECPTLFDQSLDLNP